MVCSYDEQLKMFNVSGIDKYGGAFRPEVVSLGFKKYGDQLLIICSALRKAGKFTTIYAAFDTKTGKMAHAQTLEGLDTGAGKATAGDGTIWFARSLLVEQLRAKMMKVAVTSSLTQVDLD